ncbi:hypothetical protein HRbin33_00019 [bacterium HR33]|nr:hypothetical protein HRbin33_00019 [bacterium HR33]
MSLTRKWLESQRSFLARREILTASLVTAGLVLLACSLGVALARAGVYRAAPLTVLLAWSAVPLSVWLGFRWYRYLSRRTESRWIAAELEEQGGLRRGSLSGLAGGLPEHGSSSLGAIADARTASWLEQWGAGLMASARRKRTRAVGQGVLAALAGGVVFVLVQPTSPQGADFWSPLGVIERAMGPVRLEVDRAQVRRGERVAVRIKAPGRASAVLWVRAPGDPWSAQALSLDTAGSAVVVLGPLDSDRYLRATSGGKSSDTLHIRVALPAMLASLELLARYPSYLGLADEPLAPGPEPILLPAGTRIETRGQATVAVERAAWRGEHGTFKLAAEGTRFGGSFTVRSSGRLELWVRPGGGAPWDDRPVELNLSVVADSAPAVAIPVPGADTTAPLTLRQPLVVDARDDHLLTKVELVSRRASRLGVVEPERTEEIPLPEGGAERAVLQWVLDLNGRGYLPGDTAYFRVRAYDNAPVPQMGESREYRLRLPSTAELRQAMRDAVRDLAQAADSLAAAQRELARALEEGANERERSGARGGQGVRQGADRREGGELPFSSAERAAELGGRQQRVLERARELQQELRDLAEAAWSAGLTDPEWQRQLKELEALLARAVTPELEQRLRELREALERLDPEAMREALRRLAEAGKELREELSRSRELFERAAVEGSLTTLAADAEELARRQKEWNEQLAAKRDTQLAAAEQQLSEETDRLREQLAELAAALERMNSPAENVEQAERRAQEASEQMRQAAALTGRGDTEGALRSGRSAQQSLAPLGEQLRNERDALRQRWRRDVLERLDQALAETVSLAQRQMDVVERLNRGESGADVRGEQAAIREGVDRVMQRLQSAASRNALVSPRVGATLGFSRLRMTEALDQLQRANPNPSEAADLAAQAVDGLNAMAYSLLRNRGEVAGAQSGSGLEEALAKLAELAAQQNALNGQAGGMLPLMPLGGEGLLQELRALAERQRRLAAELDRLNAQGEISGADQLAEEARQLARELESGQLDRRTIERQERLFRRLLDAGRTLRGEEPDEEKERQSETARPGNVRLPPALRPGEAGGGPRYPYPTWEQLQGLSPEQRRLILDYFRRLNHARPQ